MRVGVSTDVSQQKKLPGFFMESVGSPSVFLGSLWVLQLPPTIHTAIIIVIKTLVQFKNLHHPSVVLIRCFWMFGYSCSIFFFSFFVVIFNLL